MYRIILALLSIIAASASARTIPQTITPNVTSRLLSTPNITQGLLSTQNITPGLLSTPNITSGLLSSPQFSTPHPIFIPHTFSTPGNLNQAIPIPETSTPFIPTP
ncbi:hypothetical protein [Candidatus Nitrotoga sp. 1052]|uniref:hypothetical protein n=1 Tax=Candidatus Nitrotoga sp. 1052 TaxID=2886964 RepID=UPI001EF4ED34|nr:hypothetical protein [Candidatus Nitrotoga sp. 1052]CAH1086652.1 conserved exported hypothetical protein [Candidatus Nitrotoga sp. 1052]